jgi:hypothetical protein
MVKYFLILFGLLSVLGSENTSAQSVSREDAMYNALATPEGRRIVEQEIESWSRNQEMAFKRDLKKRIEEAFIPSLPMMINEYTAWNDLRISNDRLSLTVQILDGAIDNSAILDDYFSNFDNYICSTPVNILFMLLGYSISSSFYDSNGRFMRTEVLSKNDCNL